MAPRLATSRRLVVRAILAGAFAGGFIAAGEFLAAQLAIPADAISATATGPAATATGTVYVLLSAMVVWGICIVLVGGPLWWVVHRIGLRGWLAASVLGFALPFLITMAVAGLHNRPQSESPRVSDSGGTMSANGVLTSHGWEVQMRSSALLGLSGLLVALTIQRLAYRRATT